MAVFKLMESEFSPPDRRQIVLMISQACNLNCRYCYQTKKSPGLMSFDAASRILVDEFAQIKAKGYTKLAEIAYLGGEPLQNFDLIHDLSEWLWSIQPPVPLELTVRTNGTLLDSGMEQWFAANRHRIDVGLSMDGLSSMNRANRTARKLNWRFFTENWPSRRVKVVLFADSINLLSETVRELNRSGLPFEAVIGEGIEWTREAASILESELMELVPDYIDHPDEAVACGLFSLRIGDFFPESPVHRVQLCGDVNNIIAYDADGSPCICHLFTTPVLGHEKARWAWANLRSVPDVPFDPQCTACPIHKTCRNCFGENLRLGGDVERFASRFTVCNAIKAKARACSCLFLKQIERRITRGELLSITDQQIADRALRVLETMPRFAEA